MQPHVSKYVCLSVWMGAAVPFGAVRAQEPEVQPLGPANGVAAEAFTLIKGLREVGEHRVLVTDWIERRVVLVDFAAGTTRDIGAEGGGPTEFRLPGELIPMPDDSTLMIDHGNSRLMVIDPELRFTRSVSMNAHGEHWPMRPRASDARGVLYFTVSPFAVHRGSCADSVPLGRWRGDFESIEYLSGVCIRTSTPRPPGMSVKMNIPYIIFAKQDGWTVTNDGWVAVVRSEPYRVDWFGPDGQQRTGPVVEYEPIDATREDRRNHVRGFLASSMMSGRGADGGMGLVPASAQSEEEVNRLAVEATFEDEFPPFVAGKVWSDRYGRVWVQRAGPAGRETVVDVFDRSGRRISSYSIATGREVIGVGHGAIYATVAHSDGLVALERYALPE